MGRRYKNIKGGSDYGEGTSAPETQGYTNDATNSQQDAANAGNADGEQLNNLNNLQNGGKRRRRQRGGNTPQPPVTEDSGEGSQQGQLKAVSVDSPARETASGPYTAESQVSSNQQVSNQGVADTQYDNPGSQKGGKRKRKISRRNKTKRKSKSKSKKMKKKTVKKSRSKRSKKQH